MVITLKQIFKDSIGSIPGTVDQLDFYQITAVINETYMQMRDQYVSEGVAEGFASSQKFDEFEQSGQHPHLFSAELKPIPIQRPSLDEAIVDAVGFYAPELKEQQYDEGDQVRIGRHLFEAVTEVPNEDTADYTFTQKEIKAYSPGNGLRYTTDHVVVEDGIYWRPTETVEADSTDPLDQQGEWEQMYWERIGAADTNVQVVNYANPQRIRVLIGAYVPVLTVQDTNLFCSEEFDELHLLYLPEHEFKDKFEDEFVLPDGAAGLWREQIIQRLLPLLGVNTPEEPEPQEQQESSNEPQ